MARDIPEPTFIEFGQVGPWPRLVRNWAIRLKAMPRLGYKLRNQATSEKVLTNRQEISDK